MICNAQWKFLVWAAVFLVLVVIAGICLGCALIAEPSTAPLLAVLGLVLAGFASYAAVETWRRWEQLKQAQLSIRLRERRIARDAMHLRL